MDPVQNQESTVQDAAPATSAPAEIAPVTEPVAPVTATSPAPAPAPAPPNDYEWDGEDWSKFESAFAGRPKLAASVKAHIERWKNQATDMDNLEKLLSVDPGEFEAKLKAKDEELSQIRNQLSDMERWQDEVAAKDFERHLQQNAPDVWEYQDKDGNYVALDTLLKAMNDKNLSYEDALVLARARIPKTAPAQVQPAPPALPRSVAASKPPTKGVGDTKPRYEDMDPYEAMAHMSRNAR